MIGLPYNIPLMSQIMPNQSVPVQTTQNNFQPFQPPQPIGQQMQTTPSFAYPTNPQDPFKQPFYQLHQADVLVANQQYTPNLLPPKYPYLPTFQTQPAISPIVQTQQPSYNPLPQNVLDQIRNTISSAAPIFILPSGCHQATNQPTNAMNRESMTQQTDFNRPICCPPSFYPYPFPIPMCDPFGSQAGCKDSPRGCSCCHKKRNTLDSMNYPLNCCCNIHESEEHRCTATIDDTICSKRNCPSSISLQALASQLLSVPGIISCALTRLILRKVPGSNITNTMEDIMEKAQKSIGALNKDQLLVESRNAQQVNALINLHMTTTPPANIIPLLTLLQLKVNVLKAQVENLINKKVMECQGYGFEVETTGPIDPTMLTMKTNAELRQLLSALRQKECDERVNANFSPYHSQRVIAEARLNNVQAKIRQVEAEFERRRCMTVPTPTLTSRIVQQFSESRCMFGFAHANIFEPYVQGSALDSPDPFTPCLRNPRKLYLKPREPGQGTTVQNDGNRTTSEGTSMCKDTGTGEGTVNTSEDKDVESKSSADTCSCEGTSSEESLGEDKKKLRLKIDEAGKVTISYDDSLRDVSLLRLAPNVATKFRKVCKKDRRRGRKVKEVKRVSEEKEKVDEEIKEVDNEVDPRDKLYAKKESIDSEDYELFIFEEDPDDTDTDSEDYELFIFEEDPDDKEPESVEIIEISDSIDTPIKKKSESVEIIEIRDSTDIPTKKEPESIEVIEIHDSTDVPIKKEPESVKTSISPSADIPSKEEPESKKEIKADVNVPIKEEPKDKDEEKKSPQYTTEKSIKVGTHVAELYVEPKVKAEAEKTERTEFYIYVNAEPEIESTTMTATYVEPEIKTQPATQVIQVKEDSHVKTTPAAVVRVEPPVETEEGKQTQQLVVVPKVKTETITLVPQIKAHPHVKKIPAEKLHVEPAAKTEEGKQQKPSHAAPKVKTETITLVPQIKAHPRVKKIPAEKLHVEPRAEAEEGKQQRPSHGAPKVKTETITLVPQIKAHPQTKTATLHMEPQVKAGPVTMVPQMKAEPVTIVPQMEAGPVTIVPQMAAGPVTIVPKMEAGPVTMVPQMEAGPVPIVPQMAAGPVTIVPQAKAVPHIKKIPAEILHVEPAGETEEGKPGPVYVVPKMKTHPRTLGIPLNVPQMATEPQTATATLHMQPQAKAGPVTMLPQMAAGPVTMVPQMKAGPVTMVPQMAAGPVTIVPQAKAVPYVKKIPAEMLHVEPAGETEEGKPGPVYVVPKMKTHPRTLGIPLNVPQMATEPQTATATLHMQPQAKAGPVTMVPQMKAGPVTMVPQIAAGPVTMVPQMAAGPVTIVPQATAVPHVRKIPAEMLHVEPAVGTEGGAFFAVPMVKGEQELTNLEGNKVLETREPGESWKAQFARTRRKFEGELKEDVSKNQRTGSEAAAQPRTSEAGRSSDLQETAFYMIKPKAPKKKVIRVLRKENGPVSNEENGGSQKKNNKEKNVQFVSMMARVEYNRRFDDFWGWNINERNSEKFEDSSKNDSSQDIEKINSINEDRAHSRAESINPSIDNQQCESATEMNSEICKHTLVEKMFPKVPRKNDKKLANGLNCFPPLKRTESKSAASVATSSRKKIESSVSKTIWNSNIFHRRDSKTENNIVSRIYSMLENQFLSFSSLFSNIPNIQDLISNLNLNKLSSNTFNENNPNQQTSDTENNKRELNEKDDWILFPSATNTRHSDEHATSGGHCVSSYEGSRNVRKIKHSIIVDKEKDNYILIGGSNSGQLRALSRNGFKRPDKVRRSLIIRSRLKNPGNSKNEHSRPFTVFRRLKRSKEFLSEGMKQTEKKLEFREKLLPLPEATKALETVDDDNLNDNKENDGYVEVSQEAVSQENSKHDNDLNNNCIDTSIDRISIRSDDYRCRDK
ncbi:hypothetical protein ANTRET_LOCUS3228 [Anthophora retusa]